MTSSSSAPRGRLVELERTEDDDTTPPDDDTAPADDDTAPPDDGTAPELPSRDEEGPDPPELEDNAPPPCTQVCRVVSQRYPSATRHCTSCAQDTSHAKVPPGCARQVLPWGQSSSPRHALVHTPPGWDVSHRNPAPQLPAVQAWPTVEPVRAPLELDVASLDVLELEHATHRGSSTSHNSLQTDMDNSRHAARWRALTQTWSPEPRVLRGHRSFGGRRRFGFPVDQKQRLSWLLVNTSM